MHFGPRPAFRDTLTLEVHVLDASIDQAPISVDLVLVSRIRDVLDFLSVRALKEAIAEDIRMTRAMLKRYEKDSENTDS